MENYEASDPGLGKRGNLNRRSVVRGAAWSAPVLVAAGAVAPAFAASPGQNGFDQPSGTARWEWYNVVPSRIQVTNLKVCTASGGVPIPVGGLALTLTLPSSLMFQDNIPPVPDRNVNLKDVTYSPGASGWNSSIAYSGTGSSRQANITFTNTAAIAAGGCATLAFRVNPDPAKILQTPNPLYYTLTASGYPSKTFPLAHGN